MLTVSSMRFGVHGSSFNLAATLLAVGRVDDVQNARGVILAAERTTGDDETFVGERIHERRMRLPTQLAAHRQRPVPTRTTLAHDDKVRHTLTRIERENAANASPAPLRR